MSRDLTPRIHRGAWSIWVEWKPQDMWLGCYWKREEEGKQWLNTHIWICIVPTMPVHIIKTKRHQ